jgi:hypothetical protein
MKIIDAFTFFNELDILELRLRELYDVVDVFLIVESTHTHAGNPKISYYLENKDRYAFAADKIRHVIVDPPPNPRHAWDRERYQRDIIREYLEGYSADDLVCISDVDEIIDPRAIECLASYGQAPPYTVFFHMDFYYYTEEYLNTTEAWMKSFACSVEKARTMPSLSTVRNSLQGTVYPEKAGWHFSYFGNAGAIKTKLQEFAHQELNTEKTLAKIDECLRNKTNFITGQKLVCIPASSNTYLPASMRSRCKTRGISGTGP